MCLNSKVSRNKMTLEANLIFIGVLSFHRGIKKTCLVPLLSPLPILFGPSNSFCKINCVSLMEIVVRPPQIFKSSIACWQHNMTPQKVLPTSTFHMKQHKSKRWSWLKDYPFIFDICNNPNIEAMFCTHLIDLQSHGTPRSLYCLKKLMAT